MNDTTNTEPLLPSPCTSYYDDLDHEEIFCVSLRQAKFYGDARAAHAVAQIKAREVSDAEIDALRKDAERYRWLRKGGYPVGGMNEEAIDAAIALANGRGGAS